MSELLHYVRRALELPPRETASRAFDIAAARWAAHRQRIAAAVGPDPLDEAAAMRRLVYPDAVQHGFFRDHAVLPVRWHDEASSMTVPRDAAAAAIAHVFDLLGSGPVRVSCTLAVPGARYHMAPGEAAAAEQRARMNELLPGCAHEYDPIDWHVDFRSGYRWDERCWFADVAYGRTPGVDVKVPWELSRFQHASALGLAYRLEPHTDAGRRAPAEFRAQVVDWIAANPAGRGVNWACAMDVGLRAIGWLTGIALMQDAPELDARFRWLVARSLHAHASHIERNLEYQRDNTGNHYLSDVVALLCIGAALPEFVDSRRWCLYGMQELASELQRQVLDDGADIEGSAAYHHLVMELFLLGTLTATRLDTERRAGLARGAQAVPHHNAPPLRPLAGQPFDLQRAELFDAAHYRRLRRMADYAVALTRHDGRIAQTGDNDNGRVWLLAQHEAAAADALDRRTVLAVAARMFRDDDMAALAPEYAADAALLTADAPCADIAAAAGPARTSGRGFNVFPDGGLAVLRTGQFHLAVTFGTVPSNGTGGHFHNDLLGFVLQYDGLDFVVDGGAFLYTGDPAARDEFRATSAHSTVAVQGIEQRVWPAGPGYLFGVHRDAHVQLQHADEHRLTLSAHYADVQHERTFTVDGDVLRVSDEVQAPAPADWLLNLHPDVHVAIEGGTDAWTVELQREDRHVVIELVGVERPQLEAGCCSTGYGVRVPNRRVRARINGTAVRAAVAMSGARLPQRHDIHASELLR